MHAGHHDPGIVGEVARFPVRRIYCVGQNYASLGGVEIPREAYELRLAEALQQMWRRDLGLDVSAGGVLVPKPEFAQSREILRLS